MREKALVVVSFLAGLIVGLSVVMVHAQENNFKWGGMENEVSTTTHTFEPQPYECFKDGEILEIECRDSEGVIKRMRLSQGSNGVVYWDVERIEVEE